MNSSSNYPKPEEIYAAWLTLRFGEEIETKLECRLFFRKQLEGKASTRVHLFRGGMWITSKATKLRTSDFRDCNPFDAVILLEKGEIYDLVRRIEGPEHLGLKPLNRLDLDDKKAYQKLFGQIKEELADLAGELIDDQGHSPINFAPILNYEEVNFHSETRIYQRRSEDGPDDNVDIDYDPEEIDTNGPPTPTPPLPGPRPAPKPRPSTTMALPYSVNVFRDRQNTLVADWRWSERQRSKYDKFEIHIRLESGSDETCDGRIPPEYLAIRSITKDNERVETETRKDEDEEFRSTIISNTVEPPVNIELDQPLPSGLGLTLELVGVREE